MNVIDNPRTIALAVSIAVFVLQLAAFGSGANTRSPDECSDMILPSAITVPPVAPGVPGFVPSPSESRPVSI